MRLQAPQQRRERRPWLFMVCLLYLPNAVHAGSSWDVRLARFFFGRNNVLYDDDACHCVSPFDDELCRVGAIDLCKSLVCFDSDALCDNHSLEEFLFLQGCNVLASVLQRFNCEEDRDTSILAPTTSMVSDRRNAEQCFDEVVTTTNTDGIITADIRKLGIRHTEPSRGTCEAGACCTADNLCPNERTMHFIFLGYGIAVDDGNDACSSSVDYYGPNADCSFVTDGRSNDAVVCRDANVLVQDDNDDTNYCEVSFTATNDVFDLLGYVRNYINVGDQRHIVFESPDGTNNMEFTAIRGLADIALGPEDDDGMGIIEIAFEELQSKGCFTRENPGVYVVGHSLGGFLANVLLLRIAAEYPDVALKITTAGEPAGLVVPLQGPAAALDAWKTKRRYITGTVLPGSNAIDGIGTRTYGLYESYDFVPQVIPGGLYMEAEGSTTVTFLCESLLPDGRLSYFMDPDGCAVGRDDVENTIALFPMEGILEEPSLVGFLIRMFLSFFLPDLDSELRRSITVWLSVASTDLREDFVRVLDLHLMRRYMKMLDILTRSGEQCDGTTYTEPNPLRETCL